MTKAAHRLGDRVAVGILKIQTKRELAKSKTIRIILSVIRESFLYPNFIEMEIDKVPNVSLSLLRDLKNKEKDASMKEDITNTFNFILEKTNDEIQPLTKDAVQKAEEAANSN